MQASFEKVAPPPDASFRCFERREPSFGFSLHYHREFELTLITAGQGTRVVGDHIGPYECGDLVLLGPNLPHTWLSEDAAAEGDQAGVVSQFTLDALGTGLLDRPEMTAVRAMLDAAGRGLFFEAPQVAERLAALPEASPGARLVGLIEVLEALSRVRRRTLSSEGYVPTRRKAERAKIETVCRYLAEHFESPICQADVAALIGMEPASFCRLFRRATGRTMTAYVNELRIGRACRLLMDPALRVADVCYRVGFGNLSHFNQQFRRIQGTTPRAFRARLVGAEPAA